MHPAIGRIKATRRRLASLPREDGNILRIIRGRMSFRVRSEHGHVYGDRLSKSPAEARIAALVDPCERREGGTSGSSSRGGSLPPGLLAEQQPIPTNFVAALAAVATNATSATTKSKNLYLHEIV